MRGRVGFILSLVSSSPAILINVSTMKKISENKCV